MDKRKQKIYGRIGGKLGGPIGGKATGARKRRGDSSYYSDLAKRGAALRAAAVEARQKAKGAAK